MPIPDESLDLYLSRLSRRGAVIYRAIAILVAIGLVLLPIVRVPLSIHGAGILRPGLEKHQVRIPRSGLVESILIEPNDAVGAGAELVRLQTSGLRDRLRILDEALEDLELRITDLELLVGTDFLAIEPGALRTLTFQEEARRVREERAHAALELDQAGREHDRIETLVERQLLPSGDLEVSALERARADAELHRIERGARTRWNEMLPLLRQQRLELRNERGSVREEIELYTIRAPVSGSIEEMLSLSPGSYLHAGDLLLIISPDSGLIAEVLVGPEDVGLLRPGTPARLLIDAFHYADWGVVRGRISSISGDYLLIDQRPVFRIAIALEDSELRLRNQVRGEIRKGMTLQARFLVAERTLWQMLRNRVTDVLDPSWRPGITTVASDRPR